MNRARLPQGKRIQEKAVFLGRTHIFVANIKIFIYIARSKKEMPNYTNSLMKKILLLGAGRSASTLIQYLAHKAAQYGWQLSVGDRLLSLAESKVANMPHSKALAFDIQAEAEAAAHIAAHDLVISLLPPALHIAVAKICLRACKHLLTASYVSSEMWQFDAEAQQKGLLFLNEMGLDPGLDHMSAMQVIHQIQAEGGYIRSFKSYTGGLIAPESDNNPWGYKFTWNPQNVVLAGQGTARYLAEKQLKFIPYQQLFRRVEEVEVEGWGAFEAYANRDSLPYRELYGLAQVHTLLRGTLRKKGYCAAWNVFVQLGMTENQLRLPTAHLSARAFLNTFLPYHPSRSVEEKLCEALGLQPEDEVYQKIAWLGLFEEKPLNYPEAEATPAQLLQQLLESRWQLSDSDKDMIVMQHQIEYEISERRYTHISDLVVLGENQIHTAMAKTVGLPLGIAAVLLLEGKLSARGVQLPLVPEIYKPVLEALAQEGIVFCDKVL